MDADAIVVGAGLAGLVAAAELADAGRRVIILDQEPEGSLGGQAFWSFGGLFFVDTPELRGQGLKIFPIVGWAERGGYLATGHGNSLPRFHVTWGTGPGVIEPFVRRVREAESRGLITFRFRHRVTALSRTGGAVDGVQGDLLE